MNEFSRGISEAALRKLQEISAPGSSEHWWKDLIRLWKPSGVDAGESGLRLAVRDETLNFYFQGNSVGQIGFAADGTPSLAVHEKYVRGTESSGNAYLTLRGKDLSHKQQVVATYSGTPSLLQWIENTKRKPSYEKPLVDVLVGDNASVIDLEMGLPAFEKSPEAANRIDCVALEEAGPNIRIIFWEAKRADDSRLRAEQVPEVLKQIRLYRQYLGNADRAKRVEAEYRKACQLLMEFQRMANANGNSAPLSPLIERAAKEPAATLRVEPGPRLVLFSGPDHQTIGNWEHHRARLWEDYGIPYLELTDRAPKYVLRRPEMVA